MGHPLCLLHCISLDEPHRGPLSDERALIASAFCIHQPGTGRGQADEISAIPGRFRASVQRAIWQYLRAACPQHVNGNQIDDHKRCANGECSLYSISDRKSLYQKHKSMQ